jgi:uncharacterized YccA/Bax inhibitor family protein
MAGIIITACFVAVDALFVGTSLGYKQGILTAVVLDIISFISFFLCDNFTAMPAPAVTGYIVGGVFILLGLQKLCFGRKQTAPVSVFSFVVLWATMSVDIVLAVFGLTVTSGGGLIIPAVVAAAHTAALFLGCGIGSIANKKEYISPAALIIIGILKLFSII